MEIETPRLILLLESLEATRARIAALSDSDRAQISDDWLSLLDSATSADPWIHGFSMVHRAEEVRVGQCGFKGPATPDGVVEIAYSVEPDWQGNGYATEAADALARFALQDELVRLVRAHTLPEKNASTRVLSKCGFQFIGDVIDPDDGPVWRWERRDDSM